MCGIAGIWSESTPAHALPQALDALRHRGPDGRGTFHDGPVRLGMVRLAVIDLQGGQQPLANEDGSVVVVCNGEIYNYRELAADLAARGHVLRTGADVEVLVHLYEELGPAMCERLRGMFAFALWDKRARRLVFGRDRFGKKPLYLSELPGGGLAFASELKGVRALLAAAEAKPGLRAQGVYDFLCLGVVPQPDTIWEGVRTLEPGAWAIYDGRRLETHAYWDLESIHPAPSQVPWRDLKAQARERISDAVRARLEADVPMGLFLSGGIDSSVVAYEASRAKAKLISFTVGVPDRELDESEVSARTARKFGFEHIQLPLRIAPRDLLQQVIAHWDQPFGDASAIPSLALSRLAREHVTVVLNGDGGDELFGGYRRYVAAHLADHLNGTGPLRSAVQAASRLLGHGTRQRSVRGLLARFSNGLDLPWGERYLAWTTDLFNEAQLAALWRGPPVRTVAERLSEIAPGRSRLLDRLLATDRRVNLLSDLLVKMDMATMAYGLEARSPFLDHQLAEWAARIEPARLVRRCQSKALLRAAYRGLLPREVTRARKRGFEVPVREWLMGELRESVDHACSAASPVADFLEPTRDLGMDLPRVTWALLVLHGWLYSLRLISRDGRPGAEELCVRK